MHFIAVCYPKQEPKSISSRRPGEAPRTPILHPDGRNRPSRALGSSFSSGLGLSSVRIAHALPGFPRPDRGLRTKEKRGRGPSVGERTGENHQLSTNPPCSPSSCSVAAGTTPRQFVGCRRNFAVPPPSNL